MIPYGRQEITDADVAAVVEVLRSDFLTQGPMVPRFEEALAARFAPDSIANLSVDASDSCPTCTPAPSIGRISCRCWREGRLLR